MDSLSKFHPDPLFLGDKNMKRVGSTSGKAGLRLGPQGEAVQLRGPGVGPGRSPGPPPCCRLGVCLLGGVAWPGGDSQGGGRTQQDARIQRPRPPTWRWRAFPSPLPLKSVGAPARQVVAQQPPPLTPRASPLQPGLHTRGKEPRSMRHGPWDERGATSPTQTEPRCPKRERGSCKDEWLS